MNHVILLAAGQGQRMKGYGHKDKLLAEVAGHPMIYYSLSAFNDHPEIETITLVANKNNQKKFTEIVKAYHFNKVKKIILGGSTRQNSLEKGLEFLEKTLKKNLQKDDLIIVHNAANPLVSPQEIDSVIEKTLNTGACIVGHYVTSTIKEIDDQHIIKTHDRSCLFAAETPQVIKFSLLKKAVENAKRKNIEVTDEAMLLEAMDENVSYLPASEDNFKVTTPGDLQKLRVILGETPADFRTGIGQDSHVFDTADKGLALGGIILKDQPKLSANSDGDVILHAIFNAISQAMGDMSIGFYVDEMCQKGIKDSKKYLDGILAKMKKQKFKLNSLGLSIEAKTPQIDPLVPVLKKSLSALLKLESRRIGITATSGENLTAFGQGKGIQCFAIVSLIKN